MSDSFLPVSLPLSAMLRQFIGTQAAADPHRLLLDAHKYPGIPMKFAAAQILARQKAKHKLPRWAAHTSLVFPPKVSVEQASSAETARYKAALYTGHTMADLTGGLGADCYFFSKRFEKVYYVEQNAQLCALARHNFEVLGRKNIDVLQTESMAFLQNTSKQFDLVYLDPSRRTPSGKRCFRIGECTPNILEWADLLCKKAHTVMIKLAPMLEITEILRQLPKITEIHTISRENDCKELLLIMTKNAPAQPTFRCAAIGKNSTLLLSGSFKTTKTPPHFNWHAPQTYLYEPDVAVMKVGHLGGFDALAQQYELAKLHPNSHLFTADTLKKNFIGRTFRLTKIIPFKNKDLKQTKIKQANLTTRNFPLSVKEIRQKTGWKDGGENYIFATTLLKNNQKVLLCCKKVENFGQF